MFFYSTFTNVFIFVTFLRFLTFFIFFWNDFYIYDLTGALHVHSEDGISWLNFELGE